MKQPNTLPTDVYFNFNMAWRKDNGKPYLRELAETIKEQVTLNPFFD